MDSKTSGCHIHVGNMPFRIKTPGILLHESVGRDVDKVRALQGNNSPNASVFEYENNGEQSYYRRRICHKVAGADTDCGEKYNHLQTGTFVQ